MDRGWALVLDSDPSFSTSFNPTPPFPLQLKRRPMFQFPVTLSAASSRDDQRPSPPPDHRLPVGEVDFFSSDNKDRAKVNRDHDNFDDNKTTVKKENSRGTDLDVNTGLRLLTANTGSDQSMVDDAGSSDIEDKRTMTELAQLQAELRRMNAENQKLRDMLTKVSSNYTALQMHLAASIQQQQQKQRGPEGAQEHHLQEAKSEEKKHEAVVARQFLDLVTGTAPATEETSNSSSEERTRSGTPPNNAEVGPKAFDQRDGKGNAREESPESEGWGPNKVPKLNSADKAIDQSTETTMRKARVSVRARSEAPMINDGCQWRKYGQKMAKGNPCPRAYYRCTMAVGCPVRKQVQRCAEDRSVLITTYEGNHNHPLPPAAMAMASTTTAAATMLLSGAMSSADGGIMNPNLLARAILPCSTSMATISASAPFPTVTLDLTHSSNPSQFQRSSQNHLPVITFGGQPQNLGTVSSPQLPQVFGQALYNQSKFSGLQLSQEMGSSHPGLHQTLQQGSFADTLNAATAAITADPNFTAALAAAISSIIGGGTAHPNSNSNGSNSSNPNNTSNER